MSRTGVKTRQQTKDDDARAFKFVIEELFREEMDNPFASMIIKSNAQKRTSVLYTRTFLTRRNVDELVKIKAETMVPLDQSRSFL